MGRDRGTYAVVAHCQWSSALCVLFEELDGVTDSQNGLRRVVGNFASEFLLKRHDKLDRVETVCAEVVDEARVLRHLVRLDPEMLHDDLFYSFANVTHLSNLVRFELARPYRRLVAPAQHRRGYSRSWFVFHPKANCNYPGPRHPAPRFRLSYFICHCQHPATVSNHLNLPKNPALAPGRRGMLRRLAACRSR